MYLPNSVEILANSRLVPAKIYPEKAGWAGGRRITRQDVFNFFSGGGLPFVFFYKGWATPSPHPRFSRYNVAMTQEAAELLKKALSLPVSERADLAGSLIESLEETHDASVEAAWDEEVQRRMADIDSGKVTPVSLEEARRRLTSAVE